MIRKTESIKKKSPSTIMTFVLFSLLIILPFAIYFSQQSELHMIALFLYAASIFNIAAIAWLS